MNICLYCKKTITNEIKSQSHFNNLYCQLCIEMNSKTDKDLEKILNETNENSKNSPIIRSSTPKREIEKSYIHNDIKDKHSLSTLGTFRLTIKDKETYSLSNFEFTTIGLKRQCLGSGAFGDVFLAKNVIDNKKYAIKELNKEKLCRNGISTNFIKREIEIHSKLDHPYITQLINFEEDEEKFSLILEYAKNGTLFSKIRKMKNGFSEDTAFKYFIQTCSAVNFLHKNKLAHRDLKPENLLIDENFNIKLTDFGWCDYFGIDNCFFDTCGTYEYMAPEIVKNREYNEKVDNWSLGVLLYELLHGSSPFYIDGIYENVETRNKLFSKILKNDYTINTNLSDSCKNLIQSLLKTNPLNRISLDDVFKHEWVVFKSCNFRSSNKNKSVIVDPNSIKFDKYNKVNLEKQFSQASIDIDIGSYRKNDSDLKVQHKSSFNIRDIRNISATPNPVEDKDKIFEFKNYVVNNNSCNSNIIKNSVDPFSDRNSKNQIENENSKNAPKLDTEYIDNPDIDNDGSDNKNESIFAKFCNLLEKKNSSVSKKSLNTKKSDSANLSSNLRKNTFNTVSDNKINSKFYYDDNSNRESFLENISKNSAILEEKKFKATNNNNSNLKTKNDNSILSSNRPTAIMENNEPGLFLFDRSNDLIIPDELAKDGKNSNFFLSFAPNSFPENNIIKDRKTNINENENENNARTFTEESSGFLVASERVTGEHFKKIANRKIVDNLPINDSLNNSFTSNKTDNEIEKVKSKDIFVIEKKEEKSNLSKLINNLKNESNKVSDYLGNSENNLKDNKLNNKDAVNINKIPKSPNTLSKNKEKESTVSPNSKTIFENNIKQKIEPLKLDFSNNNIKTYDNYENINNNDLNKGNNGYDILNDKRMQFINREEIYYEENDANSNLLTIMNINYEGTGGTSSRLNQNQNQYQNSNMQQNPININTADKDSKFFNNLTLNKIEKSSNNKNGNLVIGIKSNSIEDKLMFNENCDSFGKKLSNNNQKQVDGFSIEEKSDDMILNDNRISKLVFNKTNADLVKFDSEIPIRNDKIIDNKSPYITSSFKNNFRKKSEVEIIKTDSDEKFPMRFTEKKISNISNDKKELSFKSNQFLQNEYISRSNFNESKNDVFKSDSMSMSLKNNKENDYFSNFKNSNLDNKNKLKHTNSFNLQSSGNLTTKSKFSKINYNFNDKDKKTPCIINLFFDEKEIDMVNENKIKNDISRVDLNTKIENGISKENSNSNINNDRLRSESINKSASTNKLIIRSK